LQKKTSFLILIRILKLLIGILSLSISAKYFGVSIQKDIWVLTISLITILDTAIWGPINETFRAKFVQIKIHQGENYALETTKSMLIYTTLFSTALVFVIMFNPNFFASLISQSYNSEQRIKLINMLLITAPVLLITQLNSIFTSILNAYESYIVPEISGFISSVINLIILIFFSRKIGISALVMSNYISILLLFLLLILEFKKRKILIFKNISNFHFKHFKLYFLFALPFFIPYFFGQVSILVEKTLAGTLGTGQVSSIDYSRKIPDILTTVLTGVLMTILVPVLSTNYTEIKIDEFKKNFLQVFQFGMLFITVNISIFTSSSNDIISLLFKTGKISINSLNEISNLTMFFSWTTFSVFIYYMFGIVLLVTNRSKSYAVFGTIAQLITMILNILLLTQLKIYVFPFSMFISHLMIGIIMFFKFPSIDNLLYKTFIKYFLLLLCTTTFVYLVNHFFSGSSNYIINILLNSILTIIFILFIIIIFEFEESNLLKKFLTNNEIFNFISKR